MINYNKLKIQLQEVIEKVDRLPETTNKVNLPQVRKTLIQYLIFCEEYEQKRNNENLPYSAIQKECKIMSDYIKTLNNLI